MKVRFHLTAWLGLVVPTLAIGALAIALLVREQSRLDALQQQSAQAQAQTVADNIDLIMAEIKTGVQQALQAASGPGDEETRLQELVAGNPFISQYVIWLPRRPAVVGNAERVLSPAERKVLDDFFVKNQPPPWEASPPRRQRGESTRAPAMAGRNAFPLQSNAPSEAPATLNRQSIRSISQQNVEMLNTLKVQETTLAETDSPRAARNRGLAPAAAQAAFTQSGSAERPDGSPGWLVWCQLPGSHITGAILDTDAVIQHLLSAFPQELRDHLQLVPPAGSLIPPPLYSQKILKGAITRLPIGNELPGWQLQITTQPLRRGYGFLLLGGLLVATLCTATLGAGTLLLLQARRDASEAARKTTFVSNVSHELRTPLTTIRMYAEMLEEQRVTDKERQSRYLSTIAAESQRLSRLVDNVLDFSRLEQNQKSYHREAVNVVALIQTVLEAQAPRLRAAGFEVHWEPPAALTVHTDRDALGQVLINLIDNAIKYASDGKFLQISVSALPGKVILTVEDRGSGIPAKDRQRVFTAFQRLDERLTAAVPGSGLGLSICRSILADLGGSIELGENPPHGCRFLVTLPVTQS